MFQTNLQNIQTQSPDKTKSDYRRDLQQIDTRLMNISGQLDLLLRREAPSPPNQLVAVPEAAQLLGVSERIIRKRLARKDWPVYRCGRSVRVDPQEIKALMKASSQVQKNHG